MEFKRNTIFSFFATRPMSSDDLYEPIEHGFALMLFGLGNRFLNGVAVGWMASLQTLFELANRLVVPEALS